MNNAVLAIAVSGSNVYVGGDFTQVCGNATCDSGNVTGYFIAKWSSATSSWSALGNGLNGYVSALAVSGSDVYVGGYFTDICRNYLCTRRTTVNHVAHWDGSNWSALGSGVDGEVFALAVSGSDVYMGGYFTQICSDTTCLIGNTTVNHIAHWDGSTWSALGNGVNYTVRTIAVSGSDVYAGGNFTQICGDYLCSSGNTTVNFVAHWNSSTWSALGNGLNNVVSALTVSGSDVYVGGGFTQSCGNEECHSGNMTVAYIAQWNGSTWSDLGNGVDGSVYVLVVSGNEMYVGGFFTQACGNAACDRGNLTVNGIAKWSPATRTWFAIGNGVDSSVFTLAVSGSDVYVGGDLTQVCGNAACNSGNSTVNYIARYSSSPILYVFLPLIVR